MEVTLKSTAVGVKKYGFEVSGTVTAVKESTIKFANNDSNIMTVTGKMTIAAASEISQTNNTINAAMYTVAATTTTDKQYVYTTLATAVADGAKKIVLTGSNRLEADLTIPAEMSVENKGTLTIKDEAKLSFDEKSVLKQTNATIDVDGVLYIADVKGTKNPDTITSDVTIKGEKDITYCGIAYALNNAGEGDTVKLSNETHVKNSVTIPAGVTLDTDGKSLCLHEGVVLTIDGTLYINGSKVDVETTAGTLLDDPEIVLNGTVKSKDMEIADVVDPSLEIDGAYYEISDKSTVYYYVEPVATAAPKIATVDNGTMTLKGDLKLGDVTFAGTSDVAIQVNVQGSITATSITVNLGKIVFTEGETFDGVITNGAGTVDIAGVAGAGFILTSKLIDDVDTLVISGAFFEYTGAEMENSVFTVSGTVALDESIIESMVVDGTLNVIGTNATVYGITINGAVNVANEKKVTFLTAEVFGTLAVADKTTEKNAGAAKVNALFIGLDLDDIVGAAGSVTGNVTVEYYAVVGAGSTIGNDIVKDKAFTEYYVEDNLYMTVYNFSNYSINDFDAVIEDADFQYWVDEDGKEILDSAAIGTPEKVDAKIKYEVYSIYILANVGVNDVSIDGNLMTFSPLTGVYQADVSAGKHTITYTLANGFSGEAKLAVNGAVPEGVECTLSGMEFDISGDIYSEVVLQLTGIEKSGL